MIEFLKSRPDITIEYIDFREECLRNRAKAAFERGISLEQFEKEFYEALNQIKDNHTTGE